jgi:hypothetical protein
MMIWLAALMSLAPFGPPTPAACAGRHDAVLRADDVTLACKYGYTGCRGEAVVVIENCSAAPVELALLFLRYPPTTGGAYWDFDEGEVVVPVGQQRTFRRPVWSEGRVTFEATLIGYARPLRAHVRIRSPQLEAGRAACRACRGLWDLHPGLPSWLGCRCRAKDAGRVCHSRCDCEGTCDGLDVGRPGRCSRYQGGKGCMPCLKRSG